MLVCTRADPVGLHPLWPAQGRRPRTTAYHSHPLRLSAPLLACQAQLATPLRRGAAARLQRRTRVPQPAPATRVQTSPEARAAQLAQVCIQATRVHAGYFSITTTHPPATRSPPTVGRSSMSRTRWRTRGAYHLTWQMGAPGRMAWYWMGGEVGAPYVEHGKSIKAMLGRWAYRGQRNRQTDRQTDRQADKGREGGGKGGIALQRGGFGGGAA